VGTSAAGVGGTMGDEGRLYQRRGVPTYSNVEGSEDRGGVVPRRNFGHVSLNFGRRSAWSLVCSDDALQIATDIFLKPFRNG
jgi:hypothetical protein